MMHRTLLLLGWMACAQALTGCESPCGVDPMRCVDRYTLNDCTGAAPETIQCPQYCLSAGQNEMAGCDAERTGNPCGCGDQPQPCEVGRRGCSGESGLLICRSQQAFQTNSNFWESVDCNAICLSRGSISGVCAATGEAEVTHECFCRADFL